MRRHNGLVPFLSGVFATLMLMSMVLTAGATETIYKNITVRPGIKLFIDDVRLIPRDVTGAEVDVFIYNGTTYVPARAISEALGKAVAYDGETNGVYIGKRLDKAHNLLKVCPPYQSDKFHTPTTVSMAGVKYANAFYLGYNWDLYLETGYVYFNLNGEYNTLSFDAGHRDGQPLKNGAYHVYLDGELAYSLELDAEMLPKHYDLDLHGALQMKIESSERGHFFALANLEIS